MVIELSRLCRGIFNSSSSTSFANAFTEATFGSHEHSADFRTFLQLLFKVLRRIAQRHFLVAVYFETDGDNWDYGMFEVVTRISGVLEVRPQRYRPYWPDDLIHLCSVCLGNTWKVRLHRSRKRLIQR